MVGVLQVDIGMRVRIAQGDVMKGTSRRRHEIGTQQPTKIEDLAIAVLCSFELEPDADTRCSALWKCDTHLNESLNLPDRQLRTIHNLGRPKRCSII